MIHYKVKNKEELDYLLKLFHQSWTPFSRDRFFETGFQILTCKHSGRFVYNSILYSESKVFNCKKRFIKAVQKLKNENTLQSEE